MDLWLLKTYLIVCSGVSIIAIAFALFAWVRSRKLQSYFLTLGHEQSKSNNQLGLLGNEMADLQSKQFQYTQAQTHLEEKLDDLILRINRLEAKDSQYASYHHAAKLVELGASEQEVAKTCGLSRAEADLVALVNRHQTQNVEPKDEDEADAV